MVTPAPTETEDPQQAISLPRLLKRAVFGVMLLGIAVGLRFGLPNLPFVRQRLAIQELERAGARFRTAQSDPRAYPKRLALFDTPTSVNFGGRAVNDADLVGLDDLTTLKQVS